MARVSVASLIAVLACGAPLLAEAPLQYRLKLGERINYAREETVRALADGTALSQALDQIELTCLQRQGGESLLLLSIARTRDGRPEPLRALVLYVDDAGQRRLPPEALTRIGDLEPALDLLPVLPLGAQNPAEWRTPLDTYDRRWRNVVRGGAAQDTAGTRIEFSVEEPDGHAAVLKASRGGRYWFDSAAGCVSRFESESRDGTEQTETHVLATFRERTQQPAEWCARRSDEALRFLRALNHEDRVLQEVNTRLAELPRTYQQLDQLWAGFKTDIEARSGSPFIAVADGRRGQLAAQRDRFEARAVLGARWLGQRAGTWTLQDATGQTLTSEATRQGVMIECFWSSDSAWSLRALPLVRRLQDEPTARPVRILGYNVDSDEVRAKAAIAACGCGLNHVLAWPLRHVETLPELPVVRVVDAGGIVRGVWVGWLPSYAAARELALELSARGAP